MDKVIQPLNMYNWDLVIILEEELVQITFYYMAKPVLGKSHRSDWFFLSRDFAVRTISVETVQAVYFCFGAKLAVS